MFWLDVLSRIAHVFTAIALVGGSMFMLFVLSPVATFIDPDAHKTLMVGVQKRWKRIVHTGILLLLASGFYNFMRAIPNHRGDSAYHALLGVKILLALFIFFVASALVGRSLRLEWMRNKRSTWLRAVVIAATLIVTISGYVKIRPIPVKTAEVPSQTSPTE
ncbi:MAG: hypothetical protein KDB22_08255 [Planctomycetales bacterium]|nr:hypothetical protein [Planctomycetales bacterium]